LGLHNAEYAEVAVDNIAGGCALVALDWEYMDVVEIEVGHLREKDMDSLQWGSRRFSSEPLRQKSTSRP
jgi:hypothetical protein